MNIFKTILGCIASVCICLIILVCCIEWIGLNKSFHLQEYKKLAVADSLEMALEDVLIVRDKTIGYLKAKEDTLQVQVPIQGQEENFYNQKELDHMEDVKDLIQLAFFLRIIFLGIVAFIIVLMFFLRDGRYYFFKPLQIISGIVIISLIGLIILISTNFNKYFTLFHQIFFTNDLWLLDPAEDLLIRLVPEQFFIDAAFWIGILFILLHFILFVLSTLWGKKKRRIFY